MQMDSLTGRETESDQTCDAGPVRFLYLTPDNSGVVLRGCSSEVPHVNNRLNVRRGRAEDVPALTEIYNDAVVGSAATFDLARKTLEDRMRWFYEHDGSHPLLVAEAQGEVVGFATLSEFREKPGYSRTAETSVYVRRGSRGTGVGTAVMQAIIDGARRLGVHTLVAGIVPPNPPSVALHEKLGFRRVGTFREVGRKFGRWQDVEFFQLMLD